MHRRDLMRTLAQVTGESVGYLERNGFQFHPRFTHPIHLPDWRIRLRRGNRLRSRHQRRVRFRRLF